MAQNWLLADVGGTHVRFALYNNKDVSAWVKYRIRDFSSFEEALHAYFEQEKTKVDGFIIGAAGFKKNNVIKLTNYPWVIDGNSLQLQYKLTGVYLVNDFSLQGLGLIECSSSNLILLGGKAENLGPRAIVGTGTGLGVCFLMPQKENLWHVFESEGGHISLGGISGAMQAIAFEACKNKTPLSFEYFVSGPGLLRLYQLLLTHYSSWRESVLASELTAMKEAFGASTCKEPLFQEAGEAPQVTRLAQEGDEVALLAFWMFFQFLGVFCGDLAVLFKTTGGVFLVGDMLNHPFIRCLLEKSAIRKAFETKDALADFMRHTPLYLVTKKDVPLEGLKYIARNLSSI